MISYNMSDIENIVLDERARWRKKVVQLEAEIKRLQEVIAWTGRVRPGRNPESGGAIVHMTWQEFNAMRQAIGLPPDKGRRR
jgi:hypothetical protein